MYVGYALHQDKKYNFYIIYHILRHTSQEAEMALSEHILSSLLFSTNTDRSQATGWSHLVTHSLD